MATGTVFADNAHVFLDGEQAGGTSYRDLVKERGLPYAEPEPLPFPTSYDANLEFVSSDPEAMHKLFGLTRPTTAMVKYKTGKHWFHPTIVLPEATVQQLSDDTVEGGTITVSVGFYAKDYRMVWSNRWARPAYRLWRLWITLAALVRKCWSFCTERTTDA